MHSVVQRDAIDGAAPHELERTTGIGDLIAGDPVADAVTNSRLNFSGEVSCRFTRTPMIMSAPLSSSFRIMTGISADRSADRHPARRRTSLLRHASRIERRGLPAVLLERQHAKTRIFRLALPKNFEASIDRAVVDCDHFVRPWLPAQSGRDFLEEDRNVFFLVEDGKTTERSALSSPLMRRFAAPSPGGRRAGNSHRGSLTPNARSKLAVVASATCSSGTFHSDASNSAILMTYAGSLSRPRNGTGARNGVSVSISTRSCGNRRAQSRRLSAVRNVTIPENEM